MDNSVEEIKKHVKVYVLVFVALLVLTLVTVGASYLDLSVAASIVLALIIATVKGSLVACYFMHLISEKKLIYWILGVTVILFFVALLLPMFTAEDQVRF